MNWLRAFVYFILGFLAQFFFIISGLVMSALPKTERKHEKKPFKSYPGFWFPVHLPRFAWLWDNEEDGARGDDRGWYWVDYHPEWPAWFKYWFWLAIRNPANNFKRYILGADIRRFHIEAVYGQAYVRDDFESTGFQLVKGGHFRYHLYWVHRWGDSDHALVIQLGNKFQERHNGVKYEDQRDYFKGFTFEINVYKDIS